MDQQPLMSSSINTPNLGSPEFHQLIASALFILNGFEVKDLRVTRHIENQFRMTKFEIELKERLPPKMNPPQRHPREVRKSDSVRGQQESASGGLQVTSSPASQPDSVLPIVTQPIVSVSASSSYAIAHPNPQHETKSTTAAVDLTATLACEGGSRQVSVLTQFPSVPPELSSSTEISLCQAPRPTAAPALKTSTTVEQEMTSTNQLKQKESPTTPPTTPPTNPNPKRRKPSPQPNMYDRSYWTKTTTPEWQTVKHKKHGKHSRPSTPPLTSTPPPPLAVKENNKYSPLLEPAENALPANKSAAPTPTTHPHETGLTTETERLELFRDIDRQLAEHRKIIESWTKPSQQLATAPPIQSRSSSTALLH